MKTKEELLKKLFSLEEAFNEDEEVKLLTGKLKKRLETLEDQFFTQEDFNLEEYGDMLEDYHYNIKEKDPEDTSVFEVLWFK